MSSEKESLGLENFDIRPASGGYGSESSVAGSDLYDIRWGSEVLHDSGCVNSKQHKVVQVAQAEVFVVHRVIDV